MGKKESLQKNVAGLLMAGLIFCLFTFAKPLNAFAQEQEKTESSCSKGEPVFITQSKTPRLFLVATACELPAEEEVDSKDKGDDEAYKLCPTLPAESSKILFSKERLLLQLRISNEIQSKISLFVLYHCWKTFPANS